MAENNKQKLAFKFDLTMILFVVFLGVYLVANVVHFILHKYGFNSYIFLIIRLALLVVILLGFLFARMTKKGALALIASSFVVVHILLFANFAYTWADGFGDYQNSMQLFFYLILGALIVFIFLEYLAEKVFNVVLKIYPLVLAALLAIVGFIYLLTTLIYGFRDTSPAPTSFFHGLATIAYYAAIILALLLPVFDSGLLNKKEKAPKEVEGQEESKDAPEVDVVAPNEGPTAEEAPGEPGPGMGGEE